MKTYKVERERWVSKQETDNVVMHGYDETYYDTVMADYFGVSDHGDAAFYTKRSADVGVGYVVTVVAAYAAGEWNSIREVSES